MNRFILMAGLGAALTVLVVQAGHATGERGALPTAIAVESGCSSIAPSLAVPAPAADRTGIVGPECDRPA